MTGTRGRPLRASGPSRLTAGIAAVVGLVLVLGSACSVSGSGVVGARTAPGSVEPTTDGALTEPTTEDLDAVTRLLSTRAAAVESGDLEAFMATVDPKQPRLRRQQRTLFGNLEQLDVVRMGYSLDRDTLLVAAPVPGGAPTFRPPITELVELRGTLSDQLANAVQMTFVRRASGWYVGAENQRKVATSVESPQERPWFGVPIAVRRSGDMTVLVDRTRREELDTIVASVRADIEYAADVLGEEPAYDVLIDATSNGIESGFSHVNKARAAGVYFGLYGRSGQVGSAVKLNPNLIEETLGDRALMRHELTHFLLGEFGGSSPKWLFEGIASYVQFFPSDFSRLQVDDAYYDRLMAADRRLPVLGTFNLDPAVNYPLSQAAVAWLVARRGIPGVVELMRAYRKAYDGPNVDGLTSRMLRRVYGIDETELVDGAFAELARLNH